MILSRSSEYAIRAMTFLASQPAGKLSGAREISQAERIPMQFLWKILQNLARRRLIRSFKGMRGGYELAVPADRITLGMIVDVTDSTARFEQCVLGLPKCGDRHPCPLHETWKTLRANFMSMLEDKTVADLAAMAQEGPDA